MTLAEIIKEKEDFLIKRQDKLLEGASEMEKKLFQAILNKFIEKLVVDNGVISTKDNNLIELTAALDKIFDEFKKEIKSVSNQVQSDLTKVMKYNGQYYSFFDTNGKRYSDIQNSVYDVMKSRIGINEKGGYVKGGFLDQLIQETPLRSEIKNATLKAVTGGVKLSDFIDSTRVQVMGSDNVDGSLVKYYKGFAYDTYQQFDRSTNQQFADKLDLSTFVYTGGLIDDSREFCKDKNRKVFTIEEAQRDWPNDPKLLKTKAEKEEGVVSNYSPLIDLGRWNCRHTLRFISKEQALKLRPDLEKYFRARLVERDPSLKGEDAKLQEKAVEYYVDNREKLTQSYLKENGNIINTDEARKEFIPIGYNGTNASAVHEASSALSKDALAVLLKEGKNNHVSFYAGGAGAGKTSAIEGLFPKLKEKSDAIIDGNLASYEGAINKIGSFLSKGKTIDMVYVYRDPVGAWKGVIHRMLHNKKELGRVVKMSVFLKTTEGSYKTMKLLMDNKMNDNPAVNIQMIDNSLGQGKAALMSQEKFNSIKYDIPKIRAELEKVTKELLDKGEITKTQYNELIQ